MHTDVLTYQADGLTMQSHLYVDGSSGAPKPGILVFPEAFGLSEHAKTKARQLAELGYVALACDLHGEGREVSSMDQLGAVLGPLMASPERIRSRAQASFSALAARPEVDASRIVATGFCFGGTMALELARGGGDILGAVGFHSGLKTAAPAQAGGVKAKVLVMLGADDPLIPPDQRLAFEQEMRDAKVDWQMHLYGGVVHSFTNPEADARNNPGIRYNAQADRRSWETFKAFLADVFG